jgi:NAD(P)-dependent dehydrogenase (short-subunit alcohol dehydrogenase family)
MPAMNEHERVAVVTGAGSGIGREVTRALLGAGYRVALAGRREEALRETAPDALAVPTDVTDPTAVAALFARVREELGRVDVLFNNAGTTGPAGTPDEIDPAAWTAAVETNLTGSFLCARAAFAAMRAQDPRGGRIINNGSIAASTPRPGTIAYSATKHAVTGLTKSLALDGRPFDIACGQIDIGNAETAIAEKMAKGVPQPDGSIRPEPTMDVGEVGRAVAHMASLPLDANVLFMTIMATNMPYVGRG